MIKAIIDFTRIDDNDLNEVAGKIINKMTGNATFPSPPFSAGTLQNALSFLNPLLIKSKGGSEEDTEAKNNAQKTLTDRLHAVAQYVNMIAQGNETQLLSSGFPLSKEAAPVGILDAPDDVDLNTDDTPGRLKIDVPVNDQAEIYIYQWAFDPAPDNFDDWNKVEDSASHIVLEDLESAKRVWVRVAYKATEDTLRFTEPVSKVIQ
jgi:hypothetical protein